MSTPILSEAASIELANGILRLAEQIAQQKIEQQQIRHWKMTKTEQYKTIKSEFTWPRLSKLYFRLIHWFRGSERHSSLLRTCFALGPSICLFFERDDDIFGWLVDWGATWETKQNEKRG